MIVGNKFGNRWFGLCIVVVNESMSVPSSDVMSSAHYDVDLILSLMTNCFSRLANILKN